MKIPTRISIIRLRSLLSAAFGIQLIVLFGIGIESVNATVLICEELSAERKIISDKKIVPHRTSIGYQYILEGPIQYKEKPYEFAAVLVGELEEPDLIFYPDFEAEQGIRGGIFYSSSILDGASLIVSYGNTCSGEGYELHFKLSETAKE